MGYTDLWRCKYCGSAPEIVMMGKNFYIRCTTCNSEKINVYANNIDEAVALWNGTHDPAKRGLFAWIGRLFRRR